MYNKQQGLLKQLEEKQERIDELHRLHQQTQHNLEHCREAAREQRLFDQQQFEQQKQQLLSEIKMLKDEVMRKHQEMTILQQKNAALLESNQFIERNYAQCQKENEQLKVEFSAVEKKCHEYFVSSETYQNQNKQLLTTISEQSNYMINHQAEIKILSNRIDEITNELKETKDQLKLIAQEKWELMQEKSMLEGQLKQMQKSFVT